MKSGLAEIVNDILIKPIDAVKGIRAKIDETLKKLKGCMSELEVILLDINQYKNKLIQLIATIKKKLDDVADDAKALEEKLENLDQRIDKKLDKLVSNIKKKMDPLMDTIEK